MTLTYQTISLDSHYPEDGNGMLVLRDGRLLAVLSCLGAAHGSLAGRWFIEAAMADMPAMIHETFASLEEVGRWLEDQR